MLPEKQTRIQKWVKISNFDSFESSLKSVPLKETLQLLNKKSFLLFKSVWVLIRFYILFQVSETLELQQPEVDFSMFLYS